MNRSGQIFLILLFFISYISMAQDNRAIVSIDGEDISVDDFMYVYKKNNTNDNLMDKKSIKEYLELYINFKLKVKEAEAQGLDTVKAFMDELAGYRKQLAEPYFVNDKIIDELLDEAYNRKKYDLRASHILIRVGPNAMPEDTLAAWNKAIEARNKIKAGEDFKEVAKEMSEDPSARDRESGRGGRPVPGNGGDLGYFGAFDMVYPFETGAYNTKVGEVSMPIRTDFGYHIIKVTDRIPAQGTIEAAHLFLQMPDSANAADSSQLAAEALNLYNKIENGESFEDLVKEYSDDKGSAQRGGMLPKFTVNRMVPEFIEMIATLKDSAEVSKPVLTTYGWHLIKLYGKSGIESFEDAEQDLRKKLEKSKRAQKSTEVIISDIKNEYGYKANDKNMRKIYELVDSTIYKGQWDIPAEEKLSKTVFSLGDKNFSQADFAAYITKNQKIGQDEKINEFINKLYKTWVDEECKAYEDSRLEEKYPDFRAIVKEYRDGILLFELTNEKIWSFASKDTVGLENYYNEHQNDFMWEQRLDAAIYIIYKDEFKDKILELVNTDISADSLEATFNNDTMNVVKVEQRKFEQEDNDLIDNIKWKKGVYDNLTYKGKPAIVKVFGKIPAQPKSFDEARGLITAGYQEYLEKEWIEELRNKYTVVKHQEVIDSLGQ